MYTEEEARNKWCPMGPTHHKPGSNLPGAPEVDDLKSRSRCIGSACMMWQWGQSRYQENGAAHPNGRRGYCGLVSSLGKVP